MPTSIVTATTESNGEGGGVGAAMVVILAFIQGAAVAVQGATNAALRGHVGLGAAMVVNTTPIVVASVLLSIVDGSLPKLANLPGVPPHLWLGGVYGFTIIFAAIIAFPRLGAARTLILAVTAQLILAAALDHLGAFGLARAPFSWQRAAGIGMAIGGVVLSRG